MSRNKRRADALGDALLAVSYVKKTKLESKEEALPKLPRPQNVVTEEERPDNIENTHPFLKEKLETLPSCPGVYLMRDERHRIIYVGKSACLKNRVRSYFHSKNLTEKTRWMVSLVRNFDIITVNTEMEALILENVLIKKHRPYFNILFRDDKSYPYLELTTFEKYPRLRIVRSNGKLRGTCFGPYAGEAMSVKRTKSTVQKLFKLRPCQEKLDKKRERPCLYYHIDLCTAPCTGCVSAQEYNAQVEKAAKFLSGHTGKLAAQLRQEIAEQAALLNYEECAKLRDTLQSLEILDQKQKILLQSDLDEDYISLAYDQERSICAAVVRQVREGKLQGQQNFVLEVRLDNQYENDLADFIQRYYSENRRPPALIAVETEPANRELLQAWLSEMVNRKVKFEQPQRGEKKQILLGTQENAKRFLDDELHAPSQRELRQEALSELKDALKLPHTPWRMECYDISNIQGKFSVGSMVVFEHGLPHRSHYRKFKIKGMDEPNDFAMMSQVLERRLSHLCQEKQHSQENGADNLPKEDISLDSTPDLIIVDGGLGQLNAAQTILQKFGLDKSIALAGLAKRQEELFVPGRQTSILLPLNSKAYNMVTHLRNEAHRFAITFHRNLRGKGMLHSVLADIPGLGPKYIKLLRTHFTDLAALKLASSEELQRLPGIGKKMADKIVKALQEND